MEQLEADMADMASLQDELETILYSIGDCKVTPTEDQLMNMLIGIIDMNKVRHERMWMEYNNCESVKKDGDV